MTELERRRKNAEMMEKFSEVCTTFNEGLKMYALTMKVYEFLKEQTKPLTPEEIAKEMGFTWEFNDTFVDYQKVVNPLYWLLRMGLVERHHYTKTYKFPCYDSGYYKTDEKIIDGITYRARIWVDGEYKEMTFDMYRWSVK